MRVGLNATCFNDRPSGANQRFVGIYSELFKMLSDTEFVIYEPLDCRVGSWFHESPNVSVHRTPLPSVGRIKKVYKGVGYWNKALQHENSYIFECFSLPLIKPPTGLTTVTIHDMRRMLEGTRRLDNWLFKANVGRAFNQVDHVITVSETMKNEILGFYPDLKISVIYNGININDFGNVSDDEAQRIRQKYQMPEQFIMTIGHLEKRKNYLRLIEALEILHSRGIAPYLLIVGNDSGEGKVLKDRIASAKLTGQVNILSGLSDTEVQCLYKLCSLFVFPSTYEGFGIPILEAMVSGCPMVVSDIPVFKEITQNQGRYFPPDSADAMALAIEEGLESQEERERLIQYGSRRAQDFSFGNIAESYATLYELLR